MDKLQKRNFEKVKNLVENMEINERHEKKSAILDEQRIETFNYYKTSVPENKLLSDFLLRARKPVKT